MSDPGLEYAASAQPNSKASATEEQVVIGRVPQVGGLAVLHAEGLEQTVASWARIVAATTIGEARKAFRRARRHDVAVPYVHGGLRGAPDDAFNWEELSAVGDGDWPPMPGAQILEWAEPALIDDLLDIGGVQIYQTTFNGESLQIPESDGDAVSAVLRKYARAVTRNDRLVAGYSPHLSD